MSDEQDVLAAGWVDPRDGRRSPTGATAVVPDQRTEGEPAQPAPPLDDAPAPAPAAAAVQAEAPAPAPAAAAVQAEAPVPPVAEAPAAVQAPPPAPGKPIPAPASEPGPTPYPTTPVNVGMRPRPRMPRRDPLTRMGPWAPVAGAAAGLLVGLLVVLFLAPAVDTFDQRLSLVFVVLGLSLLGAGGTLLADEVRILRRGAQAAESRSPGVGAIAGLLNGLTPARLLITASAFVLLLSAYVTGGA